MEERKFPFLVTKDTLAQVLVGDIVIVQYDDKDNPGQCDWLCGNRYQLMVTQTLIPGVNAKYSNDHPCRHQLCTYAYETDIFNRSQSIFILSSKDDNKWIGDGGNTLCTITVIGHINNLPVKELAKKPVTASDAEDI